MLSDREPFGVLLPIEHSYFFGRRSKGGSKGYASASEGAEEPPVWQDGVRYKAGAAFLSYPIVHIPHRQSDRRAPGARTILALTDPASVLGPREGGPVSTGGC